MPSKEASLKKKSSKQILTTPYAVCGSADEFGAGVSDAEDSAACTVINEAAPKLISAHLLIQLCGLPSRWINRPANMQDLCLLLRSGLQSEADMNPLADTHTPRGESITALRWSARRVTEAQSKFLARCLQRKCVRERVHELFMLSFLNRKCKSIRLRIVLMSAGRTVKVEICIIDALCINTAVLIGPNRRSSRWVLRLWKVVKLRECVRHSLTRHFVCTT